MNNKKRKKSMSQLSIYKSVRKSACPSSKIIKDKSKCAKTMRREWNNKGEKNV